MKITKRNPLLAIVNDFLIDSPAAPNLTYFWSFGSLLGLNLVLMIITGILINWSYMGSEYLGDCLSLSPLAQHTQNSRGIVPVKVYDNLKDTNVQASIQTDNKDRCGIYAVVNNKNGHLYVGQASVGNLYRRFSAHIFQKAEGSAIVSAAIDKHGIESFSFVILEYVPFDDLVLSKGLDKKALGARLESIESPQIRLFNDVSYNASLSGATMLGFTHSDETRQRMSDSWTDERRAAARDIMNSKVRTPEAIRKMAETKKGLSLSMETREKMSELRSTPEYREMVSKVHKGKVIPASTRTRHSLDLLAKQGHDISKASLIDPFCIIRPDGTIHSRYGSLAAISRAFGVTQKVVSKAFNSKLTFQELGTIEQR